MVPLEVADVVLVEDRRHLAQDVLVRLGDPEVEDLLVARLQGPLVARRHDPLGVRPGDVGVGVDHLGLEPEAELHPEPAHPVDEGVQPVGPDVRGDHPVAQPRVVVTARAEPAVVEDVALDPERRRALGEVEEPVEVVLEVDGLPHVEGDRPVGRHGPRPAAQVAMEAVRHRVEPGPV